MTTATILDLRAWYDVQAAAKRLSENSGRPIDVTYVRTLAKYGKVRTWKLGARAALYAKADIDGYVVEERGAKSGRARRRVARPEQEEAF
jgi:hypothetical protein